jgi:NAD(P)-dependent dehydrogenase (short-subunit alcohol dehydrogenase family)
MTVYVTGRTLAPGDARGWDGTVLPGTVAETAEAVTGAGGKGIAVVCDHSDDEQVAALFARIAREAGRLDLLVNNATYIHHQLIEKKPFWEKELAAANILDVGLRSAYIASWHAARMMVPQGSGLIAFGSSFGASCYMHGPAYGAQKAGIDKFAHDMEHDLRGTGVRTVSIWMGPLITERSTIAREVNPEQYEGFIDTAENPEFTGHILHAIASRPEGAALSGRTLVGAEIARDLGITDRGKERPSYREMLGSPNEPNPAAVY